LLFRPRRIGQLIKKIKQGSTEWSRYSKLARRSHLIRWDPVATGST
jgi:hypothetical protein